MRASTASTNMAAAPEFRKGVAASDLGERLVTLADEALYDSKRCGRNRVTGAVLLAPGRPTR